MFFNSFNYAIFLLIVFILYWFVFNKKLKIQNLFLLVCSYYFYSCWDRRFLILLIFSTLLDFFSGIMIERHNNKRKRRFWLWLSIIINLGFLGFFKYYNFFIQSFAELLSNLGIKPHIWTLQIILPVGISFYTFHGLSYVIDIYKKRIPVEKNFVDYALFVSFFALLVAGPIERATHLLPQLKKKRNFNYYQAVDGLRQILWGLFKKIVIADNCAYYVNIIFDSSDTLSGSELVTGAILFAFQIYGDFSGYSDIALGSSRLLGINLLKNFNYPYFSRDVAEFWRRWHISLSSWFKDYLYIPLGGSRGGTWMRIRNTFIIFLVSGFWHGANWTFIFWGGLNALFIMPSIILKTNRHNLDIVAQGKKLPSLKEFTSILLTFIIITFAWIFFRSENLHHAVSYISKIFNEDLFTVPFIQDRKKLFRIIVVFILILFFLIIEWIGRENNYALEKLGNNWNFIIRWFFYSFIIFLIFMYMEIKGSPFIYFQF